MRRSIAFSKILQPVCARVLCYQHPNPNELEELTKVKLRAFGSSIGIHQNDSVDDFFRQEEEKYCEASQDTDILFICLIKFL